MEQEISKDMAKTRERFEVLHASSNAKDFNAYWHKEAETAKELSNKVKSVITGATPVTDEVIAECKAATLRLKQISYVLCELSCGIGDKASSAAMEVVCDYQEMAHDAAKHVKTMMEWSV
jgi:hypothetical protein